MKELSCWRAFNAQSVIRRNRIRIMICILNIKTRRRHISNPDLWTHSILPSSFDSPFCAPTRSSSVLLNFYVSLILIGLSWDRHPSMFCIYTECVSSDSEFGGEPDCESVCFVLCVSLLISMRLINTFNCGNCDFLIEPLIPVLILVQITNYNNLVWNSLPKNESLSIKNKSNII